MGWRGKAQGCAALTPYPAQGRPIWLRSPNPFRCAALISHGCAASSLAPLAHETAYSSMASYKYTGYNKASPLGASLYNTYKNYKN